jgi:hypothetical protein
VVEEDGWAVVEEEDVVGVVDVAEVAVDGIIVVVS